MPLVEAKTKNPLFCPAKNATSFASTTESHQRGLEAFTGGPKITELVLGKIFQMVFCLKPNRIEEARFSFKKKGTLGIQRQPSEKVFNLLKTPQTTFLVSVFGSLGLRLSGIHTFSGGVCRPLILAFKLEPDLRHSKFCNQRRDLTTWLLDEILKKNGKIYKNKKK